jgi:hypothetical protein
MSEPVPIPRLDEIVGSDGLKAFAEEVCTQLQKDVQPAFKVKLPHLVAGQVVQQMTKDMHVDLLGFLADGWNAALELEDCRRRSQQDPAASVVASLGRHSIARDLKPTIVISYGPSKSFSVDAAVVVEGTFDGVEVAFKAGKPVSVGSGQCEVSVAFEVAGKTIGAPHTLKSWRLPLEYRLAAEPAGDT